MSSTTNIRPKNFNGNWENPKNPFSDPIKRIEDCVSVIIYLKNRFLNDANDLFFKCKKKRLGICKIYQ